MFKNPRKHTVDILFVITLFAVFAISVMTLTGVGARVYESIVNRMDESFNSRTAFTYISNKVHQSDADGNVTLGEFGGVEALIISEEIDNITYNTYLYYYDGYLKELFTRAGQNFDPKYGDDILALEGFEVAKLTPSLIKFEIFPAGEAKETLFVHLRSLKE